MKYVEYLNCLIKAEVGKSEHCVLFGQNINAGSCLGGLTRNLTVKPGSIIINTTNAENSLVGFGFGLMMNGASGVFFMKQLDFLLLGIDQLVNTYNIIRSFQHQPENGSFTILATVMDGGYEGPQSSLNNFSDFCSIARIPGFTITNKADADYLLPAYLMKPGFRIIAVSQRLGKDEIIEEPKVYKVIDNGSIFQYSNGTDVTIVSFNFSFPQTLKLCKNLDNYGIKAAHFNVNSGIAVDWKSIVASVSETKKIIVIDDSKSMHIPAESLLAELCDMPLKKNVVIRRKIKNDWLYPVSDIFELNEESILHDLRGVIIQ